MPDSRETETQQARELHLLRDERDREVDAQGAEKAGRAVLWASQLLAVLCIWQGDPAWAALLALTFVFAAAQLFHRFAADREGPPLLLGLAAAAALGYFVFRWRGFAHPGRLTAAFLLLGLLRLPKKLADRRDELVSKLLRFKSASFAPEPGEK